MCDVFCLTRHFLSTAGIRAVAKTKVGVATVDQ